MRGKKEVCSLTLLIHTMWPFVPLSTEIIVEATKLMISEKKCPKREFAGCV